MYSLLCLFFINGKDYLLKKVYMYTLSSNIFAVHVYYKFKQAP